MHLHLERLVSDVKINLSVLMLIYAAASFIKAL